MINSWQKINNNQFASSAEDAKEVRPPLFPDNGGVQRNFDVLINGLPNLCNIKALMISLCEIIEEIGKAREEDDSHDSDEWRCYFPLAWYKDSSLLRFIRKLPNRIPNTCEILEQISLTRENKTKGNWSYLETEDVLSATEHMDSTFSSFSKEISLFERNLDLVNICDTDKVAIKSMIKDINNYLNNIIEKNNEIIGLFIDLRMMPS